MGEWLSSQKDQWHGVQVMPQYDLIEHQEKNCPCGPKYSFTRREGGDLGTVVLHNAMDGRE